MATQVQIRRGTSSQVAAFTGAEGEIVVNTTNDSVHVNDGSTAGGFELARVDGSNWNVTNNISTTGSLTAASLVVDTTTLVVDATNNNVGIGVTPEAYTVFNPVLRIKNTNTGGGGALAGTSADNFRMFANTFYDGSYKRLATGFATQYGQESGAHVWSYAASGAADSTFTWTEVMRTSGSNVGIGTSSPDTLLELVGADPILTIRDSSTSSSVGNATLRLAETGASDTLDQYFDIKATAGQLQIIDNWNEGGGTGTRVVIDDSGNLLVGTTDTDPANNSANSTADDGVAITAVGEVRSSRYLATANSGAVGFFNRTGTDGDIVRFRKSGTSVGSIGSTAGTHLFVGSGDTGLLYQGAANAIEPWNVSTNGARDNTIDLGLASNRFKNLYLSGTMIGNLVKLRQGSGSMYVSPTNVNTLNGNYDSNTDEGDMWINYRGYQDTFDRFRDFRIGNGKGAAIVLVDGSAAHVSITGSLSISSSLSKGSGSFRIDHPLPAKTETHHLVHSFIEGPQADLIYRGKVTLVGGSATVNVDTAADMTEGTFEALCADVQCFTSNESGWTAVKGSVSGNTLTITAQDNSCTDTISWMVVGERKDQHMIDTDWTDDNGKVIVEPLKENN